MDSRKLLALAVVIIVVVATVGAVVYYGFGDKNNKDPSSDDWNKILEEANGQSVNMGFYAEAKTIIFLENKLIPAAKELGITVTYESYGPLAANTTKSEIDAGQTTNGTFDLIWGDTNPYVTLSSDIDKYLYQDWSDKLPNKVLLSDSAYAALESQVDTYEPGSALEFSNGQTMLVFCTDFNANTVTLGDNTVVVPYNCVVLLDNNEITGFIKVSPAGTGVEFTDESTIIAASTITSTAGLKSAISAATAYDIDTVREVAKANNDGTVKGFLKYGLPHDFTDLLNWVQIYIGQFTYPDPNNSAATFHTNLLFQAMMYELEWNADKTGWQVASDRDANVAKITEYINNGDLDTQAGFDEKVGYLYDYLADLDPYTNKEIGYIGTGQIGLINGKVVGNADTDVDYTNSTVMIGMTTVTSLDMRTDQYNFNIGAYSFDTGVKSQYYLEIPSNSSNKAGAMVVANLLISPQMQADFFEITGNAYNIDTTKTYAGDSQTIYEKYFDFTKDWSIYLSQDVLMEVTVNGVLTGKSVFMAALWSEYIG